jgi:hypothetical protein
MKEEDIKEKEIITAHENKEIIHPSHCWTDYESVNYRVLTFA